MVLVIHNFSFNELQGGFNRFVNLHLVVDLVNCIHDRRMILAFKEDPDFLIGAVGDVTDHSHGNVARQDHLLAAATTKNFGFI